MRQKLTLVINISLALMIVLGIVLTVSCAKPAEPAAAKPIVIACVGELAGAMAIPEGQNLFEGKHLAIKEFNRTGGVLGRVIEYRDIHEGYTTEEVVGAFKKAISLKPNVIIGGTEAGTTDAAVPFLKESGIPFVVDWASAMTASDPDSKDYGFRIGYFAHQYWTTYKNFVEKNGYKSFGFLTIDAGYGYQCRDEVLSYWSAPNSPVKITDLLFYTWGTASTDPEITKLVAGKPDAIVLGMWGTSIIVPAIKKLRELGYKGAIIMDVGCLPAQDVAAMPELFDGVYVFEAWIEDRNVKENADFADAVRADCDLIPNVEIVNTYIATKAVLMAMQSAGTADDAAKICDAMFKINFTTPLGEKWMLLPGGQAYYGQSWIQVAKNGKLETVYSNNIPLSAYDKPKDWYGAYLKETGKK